MNRIWGHFLIKTIKLPAPTISYRKASNSTIINIQKTFEIELNSFDYTNHYNILTLESRIEVPPKPFSLKCTPTPRHSYCNLFLHPPNPPPPPPPPPSSSAYQFLIKNEI